MVFLFSIKFLCLTFWQGKVALVSAYGIHELHVFIFVLAVVHVLYCITTLALGRTKVLNLPYTIATPLSLSLSQLSYALYLTVCEPRRYLVHNNLSHKCVFILFYIYYTVYFSIYKIIISEPHTACVQNTSSSYIEIWMITKFFFGMDCRWENGRLGRTKQRQLNTITITVSLNSNSNTFRRVNIANQLSFVSHYFRWEYM